MWPSKGKLGPRKLALQPSLSFDSWAPVLAPSEVQTQPFHASDPESGRGSATQAFTEACCPHPVFQGWEVRCGGGQESGREKPRELPSPTFTPSSSEVPVLTRWSRGHWLPRESGVRDSVHMEGV